MDNLREYLEKNYQIYFKDPIILEVAFTHSSYQNEQKLAKIYNNERLEFLGDSVLQLAISRYLYEKYPNKLEGELSKMRSSIVRTESLASFSRSCGFQNFLFLGHGEENSGGRTRDTNLENLFEAFLGALFEDQGMEAVYRFVKTVMVPHIEAGDYARVTDWKTALQEVLQTSGDTTIEYRVLSEEGPSHDKNFHIAVFENGNKLGEGCGRSKKAAEQEAARVAFEIAKALIK